MKIESLLPHQVPMLMITNMIAKGNADIHCQVSIDEHNNPFLNKGEIPGFVCLEFLAQTCGVFLGLLGREEDTEAPRSGAIVSVRDMWVGSEKIVSGMLLDVKADFLGGNQQAAMFSGQVFSGEDEVFAAKVTVAMFDEDKV